MPLYLIRIKTWEGSVIQGVRLHENPNLDVVFRIYQEKTIKHFGRIKDYDCYMVSKLSGWYKVFNEQMKKRQERAKDRKTFGPQQPEPPEFKAKSHGPGKYRSPGEPEGNWGENRGKE